MASRKRCGPNPQVDALSATGLKFRTIRKTLVRNGQNPGVATGVLHFSLS